MCAVSYIDGEFNGGARCLLRLFRDKPELPQKKKTETTDNTKGEACSTCQRKTQARTTIPSTGIAWRGAAPVPDDHPSHEGCMGQCPQPQPQPQPLSVLMPTINKTIQRFDSIRSE